MAALDSYAWGAHAPRRPATYALITWKNVTCCLQIGPFLALINWLVKVHSLWSRFVAIGLDVTTSKTQSAHAPSFGFWLSLVRLSPALHSVQNLLLLFFPGGHVSIAGRLISLLRGVFGKKTTFADWLLDKALYVYILLIMRIVPGLLHSHMYGA